jgi:hypothetical protein
MLINKYLHGTRRSVIIAIEFYGNELELPTKPNIWMTATKYSLSVIYFPVELFRFYSIPLYKN